MERKLKFKSADGKSITVEVDVRTIENKQDWETLEVIPKRNEVSFSGQVGNHSFGQIYDDFVPTEAQKPLVEFWIKHHLNGLCAGTKAQTEALENCESKEYKDQRAYLKSVGLLEDRGYEYGSGWLSRPFPEDELDDILDAVEKEEAERVAERKSVDFDNREELDRLFELIDERLGADPYPVIALMMHLGLNEDDIDDIECLSDNNFCYKDDYYYAGDYSDLEDIADDRIDRSMWVDAVVNDFTSDGFEEWKEKWIEEDLASALGSMEDECHEYEIDGVDYLVCAY